MAKGAGWGAEAVWYYTLLTGILNQFVAFIQPSVGWLHYQGTNDLLWQASM